MCADVILVADVDFLHVPLARRAEMVHAQGVSTELTGNGETP